MTDQENNRIEIDVTLLPKEGNFEWISVFIKFSGWELLSFKCQSNEFAYRILTEVRHLFVEEKQSYGLVILFRCLHPWREVFFSFKQYFETFKAFKKYFDEDDIRWQCLQSHKIPIQKRLPFVWYEENWFVGIKVRLEPQVDFDKCLPKSLVVDCLYSTGADSYKNSERWDRIEFPVKFANLMELTVMARIHTHLRFEGYSEDGELVVEFNEKFLDDEENLREFFETHEKLNQFFKYVKLSYVEPTTIASEEMKLETLIKTYEIFRNMKSY